MAGAPPLTSAHRAALPVGVERVGAGDGAVHGGAGHGAQLHDTENTRGPLFSATAGTLGKDGHRAPECPSEPRGAGRGSFTQSESVFLTERKPHKAKGLASFTQPLCQQAPAERTHEVPRKGEHQKPRREKDPEARSSAKHVNEQGLSEAEMFALRSSDPADPVPFHAAPSPTASKGASPASNVSSSTSRKAFPPSSQPYMTRTIPHAFSD